MATRAGPNSGLEIPEANEATMIDETAKMMVALLDRRYPGTRVLRGVHPKDHGCVEATFTVSENIPANYRVGVFRKPGDVFRSAIRFSNASPLVTADTLQDTGPPKGDPMVGPDGQPVLVHGSRGMAIKLYDVNGPRLVPEDRERTQDFLMINQPVFAFANIEDYKALNQAILKDEKFAFTFFARAQFPNPNPDAVGKRARESLKIIQRVKSRTDKPPPYQPPPLSPLDNTYFSAAPFSLGEGKVMKFAAKPVNPMSGDPAIKDEHYLRNAMLKRMAEAGDKDICFDFQIQVRDAARFAGEGERETNIENVCTEWVSDEWITVARIAIPPQDITTPQRQEFCETLFYTPWHGLVDHRPLGGINRLRQKVYDVSAQRRSCPVSPDLPPRVQGSPQGGPRAGAARPAPPGPARPRGPVRS